MAAEMGRDHRGRVKLAIQVTHAGLANCSHLAISPVWHFYSVLVPCWDCTACDAPALLPHARRSPAAPLAAPAPGLPPRSAPTPGPVAPCCWRSWSRKATSGCRMRRLTGSGTSGEERRPTAPNLGQPGILLSSCLAAVRSCRNGAGARPWRACMSSLCACTHSLPSLLPSLFPFYPHQVSMDRDPLHARRLVPRAGLHPGRAPLHAAPAGRGRAAAAGRAGGRPLAERLGQVRAGRGAGNDALGRVERADTLFWCGSLQSWLARQGQARLTPLPPCFLTPSLLPLSRHAA